jgi:NAD(P)-dependent dehydrogenase (short-subunit alcohol dehydrogenase family)
MITLQAAARLMISDGKGGRLLATASITGVHGDALAPAYCTSKGGVISLIRSLAVELAPHGITANAVAPGQIATELGDADAAVMGRRQGKNVQRCLTDFLATRVPLGRRGEAREVAALFVFLASEDAAFISGETVRIDGAELAV